MDGCEIRKSQRRRKNTRPKQSMATLQHIEAALLRIRRRFKEPGQLLLPEDERPFNPFRQTAFLLSAADGIGP
jgi:predicted ATPase